MMYMVVICLNFFYRKCVIIENKYYVFYFSMLQLVNIDFEMINDIFFIEYLYCIFFLILLYLYRMILYLICVVICIVGIYS